MTKATDPNQVAFFDELARSAPDFLQELLRGHGVFENDAAYYLAYCGPLVVQTACFLAIMWMLRYAPAADRPALARRLAGWGVASAIVSTVAFNVQTQDIWLSVVWGRMFLNGINPYDFPITQSLVGAAPLAPKMFGYMTYGPVWAGISTAAAFVANGVDLLAWLALKIVLLSAWLACLYLLRAIARTHAPEREVTAVAIFAWTPLTIHTAVAEGHNDIVMVMFALAYLYVATSPKAIGPLLLALSAITKYISAPLAVVDALYHLRARELSLATYVKRIAPAVTIIAAAGIYLVGGGRVWQTMTMVTWRFLEPADLVRLFERVLGVDVPVESLFFMPVFGVVAIWSVVRLWRTPNVHTMMDAQLATLAFIMFTVVGHCWPWFFIWVVPLVALTTGPGLRVFVLVSALVAPFVMVHWLRNEAIHLGRAGDGLWLFWIPSLLMYGAGTLVMIYGLRASVRKGRRADAPRRESAKTRSAESQAAAAGAVASGGEPRGRFRDA